jgi:hypothetical protein
MGHQCMSSIFPRIELLCDTIVWIKGGNASPWIAPNMENNDLLQHSSEFFLIFLV